MTELERIILSNERKLKKMKWGVRKYQTNDGRLTEEGKARYLTEEQISRINSGVERLAKENGTLRETGELKDWQWEIMLRNESEGED